MIKKMTKDMLDQIELTFLQIDSGINNPTNINLAYSYLPNVQSEVALRHKIKSIVRYYMIIYPDALKELEIETEDTEIKIDKRSKEYRDSHK